MPSQSTSKDAQTALEQGKEESSLRGEIAFIGSMLGETVRELAGEETFQVVERVRKLAWDRRSGTDDAETQMVDFISELSDDQLRVVIRSFSIFMDLLNLTEDRQRIRVLSDRAKQAYPQPKQESIRGAIAQLKKSGITADQMQQVLNHLQIELVFTAHPTDAKRRSVRRKLTRLRELLASYSDDIMPMQKEKVQRQLRSELSKLWQTDFIRPWKPSVINEVNRGLSIKPVLWNEVPKIMEEMHRGIEENFGDAVKITRPCLTFGSWIGGDRDGHPGVTAEVTQQTFQWLRDAAMDFHLAACHELFDSLSLSYRRSNTRQDLSDAIDAATKIWPPLKEQLNALPPAELCRRWLSIIKWRLEQTRQVSLDDEELPPGAYADANELGDDVAVLQRAVAGGVSGDLIAEEVEIWQRRIEAFGFHLAKLDIRQDARVYKEVLDELLIKSSICEDPASLDEPQRTQTILNSIEKTIHMDADELAPITDDTLQLFDLMHRVVDAFGSDAIGGHVISMTAAPSDVMTVLWLWKQTRSTSIQHQFHLPIVPLFETIDDLHHGPGILEGMLAAKPYRDHLAAQKNEQQIMLGYSDSTKDGGYLSACWALHQAQKELVELASKHDVLLTFFHGRGGSLGRGGGPAARSILSLPAGTFRGAFRITEQGEVLADRYDDPEIAHRHLEQVIWSSMLASGKPSEPDPQSWCDCIDQMADASHTKYRELVEHDGFVQFFRLVTPVSEIEQLPIGSRPSRRRGGASLSDLRAIPWVFSWTQSRCLIPAWYGLGTALGTMLKDETKCAELKKMYQDWPFFRACIDNAELALAKTDLGISDHYSKLADGSPSLATIAAMVSDEFSKTRTGVLTLTGMDDLLDGTPWLKESIRVRNRYIDPLNLIQVQLLKRCHEAESPEEVPADLRHLTRLTINGIAAGMRTSG
ncbi:Phosphoenolpyruvate carboxylase [Rubripirellula obstinata]|uniref:Phosphoenolpyruvate carboxylase n=1 Tax=Rubripirellula obstinata TaxID=406547 RepID=A0A5B1CFA4_9BACT|nr:phosphoenolpyruvate carboxylase [Rubripirellula obstinata]KAA1258891.1 Phosphoenolpyruvate carboxylase [Rubripirellula obstinata]